LPRDVSGRPVAFCGIARPASFVSQLRAIGIDPAAEKFYRDHHPYTEQDVHELLEIRQQSGAGGFITTEKDAINLGRHRAALEPLSVVPVQMELVNAANAVDTMLSRIAERKRLA
jgi:tetraacyldisaccharide 4'-kinase